MLTAEADAPYCGPPLSKEFLRGEIDEAELALEEPRPGTRSTTSSCASAAAVEALDPDARTRRAGRRRGRSRYDACVLATGAEPARLPVPGADDPGILDAALACDDARVLRARAERRRSAIVIGSGFIGCEAAASLAMRGLRRDARLRRGRPPAARLGEEAGAADRRLARRARRRAALGAPVSRSSGQRARPGAPPVEADLVLIALGVRPRGELAEARGPRRPRRPDRRRRAHAHQRRRRLAAGDVALARNAARRAARLRGRALGRGARPWARSPGANAAGERRRVGRRARASGRRSARARSSTSRGATASTRPGWSSTRGGAFTVWYGRDGVTVGVLAHERDEDYERGRELVEQGRPLP